MKEYVLLIPGEGPSLTKICPSRVLLAENLRKFPGNVEEM
jgi:hypothetical protein